MSKLLSSKKAISPILATLLLIVLSIVGIVVSYSWIQGYMGNQFSTASSSMLIENVYWYEPNKIDITIRNGGTVAITILNLYIDGFGYDLDQSVKASEAYTITVEYPWVSNQRYEIKVVNNVGFQMEGIYKAPDPSEITNWHDSVFRMEWGSINTSNSFETVNLANTYVSPVIVCSPQYDSGFPRTVRLTDVSSTSFKVKTQNPSGETLPTTLIHYLVIEEGVWDSPFKMEAKKHNTSTVGENNNWRYDTLDYNQTYSGDLVVLHQVMSNNDPSWITSYVSRVNSRTYPPSSSDSGFRLALNGAEAVNSHQEETIGYIIMEENVGILDELQYESKQTSDSVSGFGNSPPYVTSFSQSFSEVPSVVLVNHLEVDGADGGWGIVYSISDSQVGLCIDEDQVRDSERSHTTETCGFLVFQQSGTYVE